MINKSILFVVCLIFILLAILWIAYNNKALEINTIVVTSNRLPKKFDGFRIAQISDLHNAEFGNNNSQLISALENADADIIVITGDMVDSRRTKIDRAVHFADRAVKIAPTYYVNGNHESRIHDAEYKHLITRLEYAGVTVLENEVAEISMEDASITLVGLNDPRFQMELIDDTMERKQMGVVPKNDAYKVLLIHRPEYFDEYAGNVDLVFSGHAHGGQFILPFVGGVLAPGQGLFPQYCDGLYTQGTTNMIVSRGLGNSLFPFRINNRPEVIVAELNAES